jgi:phosphoglycerate dehydrogenase-like enzyme
MKIVVYSPFAAAEMEAALNALPGFHAVVAKDKQAALAHIGDAEGISIPMSLFDDDVGRALTQAKQIRWIHFVSSGTDPLLKWPAGPGVVVTNSADAWAPTVAEHAVAMLLGVLRQFPAMNDLRATQTWAQLDLRPKLRSLEASTVLILGFGAIGQRAAELMRPFNPRMIAVGRTARAHPLVERVAGVDEIDALLPQVDAIVAALPSSPQTRHLMSAERLALLPNNAVIVNVGRGETFDEAALTAALIEGRIAGAGLDVYEREPLPKDNPLWSAPNLILSPHVAGVGRSHLFGRLVACCVRSAKGLSLNGQPPA